ncbi:MAG TPA: serine/threonine protein kinase, partial [Polyangiaceae bacterium]
MDSPRPTPQSPSERAEEAATTTLKEYAGRTLDNRYQLIRILGRGGMGSVFLAKHAVIGKPLAVKILDA